MTRQSQFPCLLRLDKEPWEISGLNMAAEGHPQGQERKLSLPWGEEIAWTPSHEVGRKADQENRSWTKEVKKLQISWKPGKDDSWSKLNLLWKN